MKIPETMKVADQLAGHRFRYFDFCMAATCVIVVCANIIGAGKVAEVFGFAFGAGVAATFLPQATSPAFNIIAVSIGEVIGGVATFSGEVVLGDGSGVQTADLSALCSSVSSTGCSLLRLRNVFNFNSAGALLDGVSGVSNAPEPKAWALMLLGFAALGWKMKDARRKGLIGGHQQFA